ncbi:MAG: HlyD family efflux transporter periplasmic adaptor subunit [Magnetococcales bacterium]|nr:HlyD family efflux transporter periplasmic adaptor subunit [Magnetococcales bacterium]
MAGGVNALPLLREELLLHPAAPDPDGSPAWIVADPARHLFFRIGWLAFEILSRWHEQDAERIVQQIQQQTTLTATLQDVAEVAQFLANHQLLRSNTVQGTDRLLTLHRLQQSDWLHWLLHHYLFLRIPLWHPDDFLSRTLPGLRIFFTPWFRAGMFGLLLVALLLMLRQWDLFWSTVLDNLNGEGVLVYGLTLSVLKIAHELGHAYAAKRCGCRVPAMGVAFLVLWPMLYTDTTEAWKLSDKRQRLTIALGGVNTEALLTIVALFAWSLLPAGLGRNMAFWVSVTALSATLAINLSPFMRFDGYFVLCDWLDLPNLHERSFRYARWWLRERLFAVGLAAPEALPPPLPVFFILFALLTWLYRLVLFLGIAVLVYHFFIKVVGVLLFAVEMGWFILLPVWREVRQWRGYWPNSRRKGRLLLLLALLLAGLLLPWSTQLTAPGLLQMEQSLRLYVPEAARLEQLPQRDGPVAAGEALFVLNAPDVDFRLRQATVRLASANWQQGAWSLDPTLARRARVLQRERESALALLAGSEAAQARLQLRAPWAGRLVDRGPQLAVDQWLPAGEHLATLVNEARLSVETYVPEGEMARIALGATARFIPEVIEWPAVSLRVVRMDESALRQLEEPVMASLVGGPVAVREKDGLLVPENSLFRVILAGDRPAGWPLLRMRGTVHLTATPQSPLQHWLRTALTVLIREWQL